jgi:hypothetical protein
VTTDVYRAAISDSNAVVSWLAASGQSTENRRRGEHCPPRGACMHTEKAVVLTTLFRLESICTASCSASLAGAAIPANVEIDRDCSCGVLPAAFARQTPEH